MTEWSWTLDGWIIVVGILSACSCALLGNYLVLRRQSLMGDAISHAVLPGLAIAFLISGGRDSWSMFLGAVVAGALTTLLTQVITHHGKVEHGAAMGVVFSILFAAGLVLIRRAADHMDLDPGCVLYGNIVQIPLLALGEPDSPLLGLVGIQSAIPPPAARLFVVLIANVCFVVLFYKELKITSFDPELATSLGIRSSLMHYALMVMVAVTTVANFEAVGSILVIAMLIVPPVIAHLLTDRLGVMISLSLVAAIIAAVGGHVLAIYGPGLVGMSGSVNTAGMMAVVAGALLAVVIVASPEHGLVARALHRAVLASRIVRQDMLGLLYRWQESARTNTGPMPVSLLLGAVGDTRMARSALRRLRRGERVRSVRDSAAGLCVALTDRGLREGSQLIGSHRLWETFLSRHFNLALDHLHDPAERMEHFITPELDSELRDALVRPGTDPQGKQIPDDRDEHMGA